MAKTRIFASWIGRIINVALSYIDTKFVQQLPEDVADSISLVLKPVKLTVNAVSDDIPRNDEQVRKIWRSFTNKEVTDYTDAFLAEKIDEIENENIRVPMRTIAIPVVDMLRIVTDENPDNKKQIEELWDDFLESSDSHDILLKYITKPLLLKIFKNDPGTVELINSIIDEALNELVAED